MACSSADPSRQRLLDFASHGPAPFTVGLGRPVFLDGVQVLPVRRRVLPTDLRLLLVDRPGVRLLGDDPCVIGLGGRQLAFQLGHLLDGLGQLGFQESHPVFEGPRVDLEQQVALPDGLVFQDMDPHHLALNPSRHLNDVGLDVRVCGKRCVAVRQHIVGHQGRDHQEDAQDPDPR